MSHQNIGCMGVSINEGTQNRWFLRENPNLKWMMTGGTPHFRTWSCTTYNVTTISNRGHETVRPASHGTQLYLVEPRSFPILWRRFANLFQGLSQEPLSCGTEEHWEFQFHQVCKTWSDLFFYLVEHLQELNPVESTLLLNPPYTCSMFIFCAVF